MNYTETVTSKIKPGLAFVMALGSFVVLSLITYVMPFENYKVFCDIFLILCTVCIIYFLYRYALTPFEYSLSGTTLTVAKGEKRHKKNVAVIRFSEIRFFCSSSYTGKRPEGEWDNLNCCPNLKGKTSGYTLYCRFKDGKRIKIYIEPTENFVAQLKEAIGNKTADTSEDA